MTFVALLDDEEVDFLTIEEVDFCHEEALKLHPENLLGIKDRGALESALARPVNHYNYNNERDLIRLAAVLWHGIGKAHGYNDANKRTAFISAFAFLEANGVEVEAYDPGEPGRFTDALFNVEEDEEDNFKVSELEGYLRARARWITG